MEFKWFDYRFLSPLQSTELFAKAYHAAYQRKWSRNFSSEEAAKKQAFRRGGWRSSMTERTSCWKARQFADLLGAPYDFFCDHALEFCVRRGWRRPPRPNQLYSLKNVAALSESIEAAWTEYCSDARWMISELPQYHLTNYRELPAQCAHQDWVVETIRRRHMPPALIAKACFALCVLPLERAYFEFGPGRVDRARGYAELERLTPLIVPTLGSPELRLSCFGIVHSFEPSHPTCACCPWKHQCEKVVESLGRHIVRQCGHIDPAVARRRKLTRERVRAHRQRKASTASMTS